MEQLKELQDQSVCMHLGLSVERLFGAGLDLKYAANDDAVVVVRITHADNGERVAAKLRFLAAEIERLSNHPERHG